jgi:hypothetical protein
MWKTRSSVRGRNAPEILAYPFSQGVFEMITEREQQPGDADLQELLRAAGLMGSTAPYQAGTWCEQTQRAVLEGYRQLGWKRAQDGRWISSPALAALAARAPINRSAQGGTDSAGGAANLAGGPGNLAGGPGNLAGGPGNLAG